MIDAQVIATLERLTIEQQIQWMLAFGAHLTVSARLACEPDTHLADGRALRGINEIQHRIYARIRDMKDGHEWTIESFVSMILEYWVAYDIEGDVGWALKRSLPEPTN